MLLIQGAKVLAPHELGLMDVFIASGKICALDSQLVPNLPGVERVDGKSLWLTPGLVDGHAHIAGAGGEGGPASRTQEMTANDFFAAGVTSVVGCLGMDGYTRTVESVLMKARQMRAMGLSAYLYTGAYQVPPPTISGNVARDLAWFEEVIGVGEIAIADHRGSAPTMLDLVRLTHESRLGGMLGGKAGIVHFHMGDARDPFSLLEAMVAEGSCQHHHFFPTHVNRNAHICEQAKQYGKNGPMDVTASSWPYFPDLDIKPSRALNSFIAAGVPLANLCMSSDAGGSLPEFDERGDCVAVHQGKPDCLHRELLDLIHQEGWSLSDALRPVTENPARVLKLKTKGQIAVGKDADLLLLNEDLNIHSVYSTGIRRFPQ
ncbi:MAG: beta-aspartyl-peptidase [Acidobacteria bacterium]|nr:beta-aspartyl-peptidase [Acidobacteriota bacterium]